MLKLSRPELKKCFICSIGHVASYLNYLGAVACRICQWGMVALYQKKYYHKYSAGPRDSFSARSISEHERLSKLNLLPL